MKSVKSLIGMPVIMESRTLGRVCAATPDAQLQRLERLYFSAGQRTHFVTAEHVDCLGDVSILVHAPGEKGQPPSAGLPRRALSTCGVRLGLITDALLDEASLNIAQLELSQSLMDDLTHGRRHIGRFCVLSGGEVVIEETEGGIVP